MGSLRIFFGILMLNKYKVSQGVLKRRKVYPRGGCDSGYSNIVVFDRFKINFCKTGYYSVYVTHAKKVSSFRITLSRLDDPA